MAQISQKISSNKSKNKEYQLPCTRCSSETRHIVLQSVDVENLSSDNNVLALELNQIVQCKGCESISFRTSKINTADSVWDDDLNKEIVNERVEVYPSRVAGRHQLRQAVLLPSEISQIYFETHAALCNKLPILAAIGIRALIEAVCMEKGARGKNLETRIEDLVRTGILTETGASILHKLRDLGNTAAHQVTPHSEDTLGIAMDVAEHLLNEVYLLPKVAGDLPSRKRGFWSKS